MTIGSEYVMIAALLAVWDRNENTVSFPTIRRLGWEIQKNCNRAGIDAIIMTGAERLTDIIKAFSEYLRLINGPVRHVAPANGVSKSYLEDRLIVLPVNVRKILQETAVAYL